MAKRPIYEAQAKFPFYKQVDVDFDFFPGFSISQNQKSINSLHNAYLELNPNKKILEISSKSPHRLGVELSAFNLKIRTTSATFSVESAYQGSKVFEMGGPYTELFDKTSREAKKYEKLYSSGKLIAFKFFDEDFPLTPNYFYDWLYINALKSNEQLSKEILQFDCFSDIVFNPHKSLNCQAKAAAIFIGLSKSDLLEKATRSKEEFLRVVCTETK